MTKEEEDMNKKENIKKGCHPGKFLSGISRLLNQISKKSLFITTLSKEDPGQQPAGTTTAFGFTLIELLVVVLIIGILAAIALPQYQKAVMKAHLATVKDMTSSLVQAEELYHLSNGSYTQDFDALDVTTPEPLSSTTEGARTYRNFRNMQCILQNNASAHVNCGYTDDEGNEIISVQTYLSKNTGISSQTWCVAGTADLTATANKVCQADTGKASHYASQSGATWTVWLY